MGSPIADGVMAATHRLVQQAMSGRWQEVPKTVEERKVLLDRLSANASPQDRDWVTALQQAVAESDAAVAQMANVSAAPVAAARRVEAAVSPDGSASSVDSMMDLITRSR
jgi:hypothetical protein